MTRTARQLGRRSFLKKSAVASSAFAAALETFRAERAKAEVENKSKSAVPVGRPVNIAIIGTGAEGMMLIGQAVKSPGVFCRAVCDVWPPSRDGGLRTIRDEVFYSGFREGADLAEALKIAQEAKGYADYREMLEKEKEVEAIIIATPLHMHAEMVLAALAAGKHVYCEKMMAKTIDECKSVGRAARDYWEKGKRVVQFGHQQHWNESYVTAYKLIQNDKVCGNITHMKAWWCRNATWRREISDEDKSLIDPTKYGYKDADRLRNWRLYWEYSGGLMSELACHQIAITNWYVGAVPSAVMGMAGEATRDDWGGDVWDNVQCIFRYPSARNLTYQSISTNCHDGQAEQFMGPEGTVVVSRTGGLIYREPKAVPLPWQTHAATTQGARGGKALMIKPSPPPGQQPGKSVGGDADRKKDPYQDYRAALADWAACIREGLKPKVDWQLALNAAVPCIMANEAMRKQTWIEIRPESYQL